MSYLLVQLFPEGATVPVGAALHSHGDRYTFYPLPNEGPVWTLDDQLWRATDHCLGRSTAAFALEMQEAVDASESKARDHKWLAGVIEESDFWPLGRDERLALPEFSEWKAQAEISSAISLGFDVLDAMGLSALTNVGFTAAEAKSIADLGVVGNENGLLTHAESAEQFAKFANIAASEHAPFVGVQVFAVSRALPET